MPRFRNRIYSRWKYLQYQLEAKWDRATGHKRSFGLNRLDTRVLPYLRRTPGFFVEAGANDGIAQSNTLLLERSFGWRGLLIEPIPELAALCRRNRPDATVVSSALVAPTYQSETIEMNYCNLMSIVKGARGSEEADKSFIEQGVEVQQVQPYSLSVPAATLSSILDRVHVHHIDFLSLDVEGFELEVLKGLDFSRHRPSAMLIESWDRASLDHYLEPWYAPVAELTERDVLYFPKLALD